MTPQGSPPSPFPPPHAVTGGGGGLGRALVQQLVRIPGVRVAVVDSDGSAAGAVVEEVVRTTPRPSPPLARAYTVDVTCAPAVAACVRDVEADFGRPVDVLVNNAGVLSGRGGAICNGTDAAVVRTFAVTALSHFWTLRAVLPAMLRQPSSSAIVTVVPASSLLGVAHRSALAAATSTHEGVRREVKKMGAKKMGAPVRTLVVLPFCSTSGLFGGGVTSRLDAPRLPPGGTPEALAARILLALGRGEETLALPRVLRAIPPSVQPCPRPSLTRSPQSWASTRGGRASRAGEGRQGAGEGPRPQSPALRT